LRPGGLRGLFSPQSLKDTKRFYGKNFISGFLGSKDQKHAQGARARSRGGQRGSGRGWRLQVGVEGAVEDPLAGRDASRASPFRGAISRSSFVKKIKKE
jgi:hypothetical protein